MAALMTTPTIAKAAEKSGVSERTIKRRLSDPVFAADLKERRAQALDDACKTFQLMLMPALGTTNKIITDEDASPQVRLNAANMVFGYCLKYIDALDVQTRLARLEAMMDECKAKD